MSRKHREPTANEVRFPWHTRPMADSLAIIEGAGYLGYASPKVGSVTFTVKLKRGWDAPYGPDALNGLCGQSRLYHCQATDVHRVAREMQDYTRCCAL